MILFLGGGVDSLGIVYRAREMGFSAVVADSDPNAPAIRLLDRADRFILASAYSVDDVLRSLTEAPLAVLCAGVDAPHVMAAVAERFDLVGPSPATAELSRDKVLQIKALMGHVKVPWTENADLMAPYPGGEYVLKPADSRGARGVIRVKRWESAEPWIPEARARSPTGRVLIQEWVYGAQLSSESLVQDGKILWTAYAERNYDRLDETHPYVIEDGSDMPPGIPSFFERDWEMIGNETLQKCVDVLGFVSGTLKGDLVWDGKEMTVIEVACRLSGGRFCSDLIPACWGVDFVGMAIRIALGEKVYPGEIRPYLRRHVCQRFQFSDKVTSHPQRGRMVIGKGGNREEARLHAAVQLA